MTVVTSNILFSLAEKDILKAILEFLESRGFHITQVLSFFSYFLSDIFQLSLERETGVINGEFSEDVLFLRQLILDGQWDNALDFIEPLKDVPEFDLRTFRYLITKHKYFELLCIKQEPGPLQDNDFAVEVSLLLSFLESIFRRSSSALKTWSMFARLQKIIDIYALY